MGWTDEFERIIREFVPGLSNDLPLTENTPLREHGLQSLAIVRLLTRLEDEFSVVLPDSQLTFETFATPGTIWNALVAARDASDETIGQA